MVIRKIIGDMPRTYEETLTVNNQKIINFAHYPLYSDPIVELDGVVVAGTTDREAGTFTADSPMTGTIHLVYSAVWFTDDTINNMSVYKKITVKCLPISTNTFVMSIPYYPVNITGIDENSNTVSVTYSEENNTYTATANELTISGTFLDIYSTAGTLLLMKANMPEQIKREFASFNDWGKYPDIAKGLENQAMAWFKMSGE